MPDAHARPLLRRHSDSVPSAAVCDYSPRQSGSESALCSSEHKRQPRHGRRDAWFRDRVRAQTRLTLACHCASQQMGRAGALPGNAEVLTVRAAEVATWTR